MLIGISPENTVFYLIINGNLVIPQTETYLFIVQRPETLQVTCVFWVVLMGILSSPVRSTSSLLMFTRVQRWSPQTPSQPQLWNLLWLPYGSTQFAKVVPLLCSWKSMFLWQVGTNSWTESPLVGEAKFIFQIVFFKGQMLAMDSLYRLNTISLAPQLSMQEVTVVWGEDVVVVSSNVPCLVVCGTCFSWLMSLSTSFKCLHFSAKPAKWVESGKVGKLGYVC